MPGFILFLILGGIVLLTAALGCINQATIKGVGGRDEYLGGAFGFSLLGLILLGAGLLIANKT